MTKRIMIDLETLSLASDEAIVQIGACEFDGSGLVPGREAVYGVNILMRDALVHGSWSPETMEWWTKESRMDALKEKPPDGEVAPICLAAALMALSAWIRTEEPLEIWCHAYFDEPILRNAYRACGLIPPWRHTDVRCVRTILEIAREVGVSERLDSFAPSRHCAWDDAIRQAGQVIIARDAILNRKSTAPEGQE